MTKEAVLKTPKANGETLVSPLVDIIDLGEYKLYLYGENIFGAVLKKQGKSKETELFRVVKVQTFGGSDSFKKEVNEALVKYTGFQLNMMHIKTIMLSFPAKAPVMGCTYSSIEDFNKTQHYRGGLY